MAAPAMCGGPTTLHLSVSAKRRLRRKLLWRSVVQTTSICRHDLLLHRPLPEARPYPIHLCLDQHIPRDVLLPGYAPSVAREWRDQKHVCSSTVSLSAIDKVPDQKHVQVLPAAIQEKRVDTSSSAISKVPVQEHVQNPSAAKQERVDNSSSAIDKVPVQKFVQAATAAKQEKRDDTSSSAIDKGLVQTHVKFPTAAKQEKRVITSLSAIDKVPVQEHVPVQEFVQGAAQPIVRSVACLPRESELCIESEHMGDCYLDPQDVTEMYAVSKLWPEVAVSLVAGIADYLCGSEPMSSFSFAAQEPP